MWSATWPKEVRSLARDFFTTEVNDGQVFESILSKLKTTL